MPTGSPTTDRTTQVLVTGVEQPLGRAVALTLAARWNVIAHSFTLPEAQQVVHQIHRRGGHAHAIAADLTVDRTAADMYRQLRDDHKTIGAVLHCASLPGPEFASKPLEGIHPWDWYRITHLHLAMLLHTVQGAVTAFNTSGTPGVVITVTRPADTAGGDGSLARATIDGASAAFMSALNRQERTTPLTLRHVQWTTTSGDTRSPALTRIGDVLDAALEAPAEAPGAAARTAI